jgi:hypothetical protein
MGRHYPKLGIRLSIHHTNFRRANALIDPRLVSISSPVFATVVVAVAAATAWLLRSEATAAV